MRRGNNNNNTFVLFCLVYCYFITILTCAKPTDLDKNAIIEDYSSTEGNLGTYYSYKTSNGIEQQQLFLVKDENLNDILQIRGSYQYTDTNGKLVEVNYVADENGYRVVKPLQTRFGSPVYASLVGGGIG